MKYVVSLLSLFVNFTVGAQQLQKITLAPYMTFQYYEHFNRLVLESSNEEVEFITGFDFEWGYYYDLEVIQTEYIPTLSDGTKYAFKLHTITSKKRVTDTTTFEMFLHPRIYSFAVPEDEQIQNQSLIAINDSVFLYFETVEIEVPQDLLLKFREIITTGKAKKGVFTFRNDNRIRLIGFCEL